MNFEFLPEFAYEEEFSFSLQRHTTTKRSISGTSFQLSPPVPIALETD